MRTLEPNLTVWGEKNSQKRIWKIHAGDLRQLPSSKFVTPTPRTLDIGSIEWDWSAIELPEDTGPEFLKRYQARLANLPELYHTSMLN